MIKKLVKHFYEPVYKTELWFLAGYTHEQFIGWLKKRNLKPPKVDISQDLGGFDEFESGGKYPRVLWIKKYGDYYTMVHEIIHLVLAVMYNKGVPIRKENEEVVAYLTEYWSKQLWRTMSKPLNKLEKRGK